MIPKIIHYCWFGPRQKSSVALKCIESWKLHCPDYEIKEWNEGNSKEFQNKFYRDAIRKKKYAFAADAMRVKVLQKYGGIYMDLDMLVLKSLDPLLEINFFTGFEVENRPAYGLFGAEPNNRLINEMVNFYDQNYFNEFSLPVITHAFKDIITEGNMRAGDKIFPTEAFYALNYENRGKDYSSFVTSNSYAVHLWDHSWSEAKSESITSLVLKISRVKIDYFFYGYPFTYFKRYIKEFSRKLYHKLIGKKSS